MQEVENTQTTALLTSEELRSKAIAISQQRGQSVAKRRVAKRWVTWFLWSWILPIIGSLTVLMAVASMSLVYYFGPAKVIDSAQNWLIERFGIERPTTKPDNIALEKPQAKSDTVGNKTTPDQNIGISNAQSVTNSASTVILQFDRDIELQNSKAATPNNSSSSRTNNANSVLLPKGTQQ